MVVAKLIVFTTNQRQTARQSPNGHFWKISLQKWPFQCSVSSAMSKYVDVIWYKEAYNNYWLYSDIILFLLACQEVECVAVQVTGKVRWVAWCNQSRKCPARRKPSSLIRDSRMVLQAETLVFAANQQQTARQSPAQRQRCLRNGSVSVPSGWLTVLLLLSVLFMLMIDGESDSWVGLHNVYLICSFPGLVTNSTYNITNIILGQLLSNLYSILR